jgi:hypothetical protein
MELHFGSIIVRGTQRELAEFAAELHRRGLLGVAGPNRASAPPQTDGSRVTERTEAERNVQTLARKIKEIPTSDVIAFVKQNPAADVREFTGHFLRTEVRFGGGQEIAFRRAYNRLAHARKVLNLAPPGRRATT